MLIKIEKDNSTPVYIQIKEQLKIFIREKQLEPGTRLPNVRKIAEGADVVLMSATAMGILPDGSPITRRGCEPGDRLFVSGPVGLGSAFAVLQLEATRSHGQVAHQHAMEDFAQWLDVGS